MNCIYFDLETSETNPIGQILNFAFIEVNKRWEIVSELTGEVKVSRLQLPHPGAILANKINVLEHQKQAKYTEKQAMFAISEYLKQRMSARRGKIALIGYNSSRFDIPFLRTSLIRNGINPYHKRIINKDLFQLIKYLSCTEASFPRKAKDQTDKLSLKLETITKEFKLLQGQQTHNSYDDVLLTIKLAKYLSEAYDINIADFEAYQAPTDLLPYEAFSVVDTNYNLNDSSISTLNTYVLIDQDNSGSLWLDLDVFKKQSDINPIRWVSKKTGYLFSANKASFELDQETEGLIVEEYGGLTIKNYFTRSKCDIEQDIYRLDFDARNELEYAIWHSKSLSAKNIRDRQARILFIRHRLREHSWGSEYDSATKETLKKYAKYRYAGQAVINKFNSDGEKLVHLTFDELNQELCDLLSKTEDNKDLELLEALKGFYDTSDIKQVLTREELRDSS